MEAKILIVDDEKNIAEGIGFLIGKLVPECQVVGIAFSGDEGIAAAKAKHPDIILTDIRMGDMDGLAMIEQLKSKGLTSHFIVISGYADFAYARTAIHLGVEEYVTKPVEEEELAEAVRRCIKKIADEQADTAKKREMEMTIQTYGQDMLEYRIKDLLIGPEGKRKETLEELKELGFPADYKSYACAIVDWGMEEADGQTWKDALKKLAGRELSDFSVQYLIPYEKEEIILLLASGQQIEYKQYISKMKRLRLLYEERINVQVS